MTTDRRVRKAACKALMLNALLVSGCDDSTASSHEVPAERCSERDGLSVAEVLVTSSRLASTRIVHSDRARVIGTAVGDSIVQFGRITDVATGPGGRLYVADALAHEVLALDDQGRVEGRIGGQGDGPGEFRGWLFLDVDSSGALRVYDAVLGRVSLFDPIGNVLDTFEPERGPDHGQMPEYGFDSDGHVYELGYRPFLVSLVAAQGGRSGVTVRGENEIQRWDRDTRRWVQLITVASTEVYVSNSGLRDAPFGRRPLWSVRPSGGVWYTDSGAYVLHRIDAAGVEECKVVVEWPRRPVTNEVRERYRSATDVDVEDPERIVRIRSSRRDTPLPDDLPAIRRIEVSDDGRIWVLPESGEYGSEEPDAVLWHVFADDGSPEFRVSLPSRLVPYDLSVAGVWGVERDSLDVQRLAFYRLRLR